MLKLIDRLPAHLAFLWLAIGLLAFSAPLNADDAAPASDATEASVPVDEDEDKEKDEEFEEDDDGRRVGTNVDTLARLDRSLPKHDSLFDVPFPKGIANTKKRLYEDYGLKLGASYQTLYQSASDSLTGIDSAWGGWFVFHGAWTAINQGEDWEGKFVFALDGRHPIDSGRHSAPAVFSLETGSLWPTDAAFFDWDIYPAIFFWEQWGRDERFAFRIGQQGVLSVLDNFRFDSFQTAFTSSIVVAPATVIPFGAAGLTGAARWWPVEDSDLYVRGVVSDLNSPAGSVDWSGMFDEGEVLVGAEIGYDWKRSEDDYDHLHLTVWHGDEVSSVPFETKAGWGAKVSGHKQWDSLVGFASYAYNTAEGGPFGLTLGEQAANLGLATLQPFGTEGEIALAASWAKPLDSTVRDQYAIEAYWKVLLLPNLWATPGFQYIIDPSFNPDTNSIFITQIKLSLFL